MCEITYGVNTLLNSMKIALFEDKRRKFGLLFLLLVTLAIKVDTKKGLISTRMYTPSLRS